MGKSFNCGYRDKKGGNFLKGSKKKSNFDKYKDSDNDANKLKERYNFNKFSKFK